MPNMPYAIAKGRIWNIIEDYLSYVEHRIAFLNFLEIPDPTTGILSPLAQAEFLRSQNILAPTAQTADRVEFLNHVEDDWFVNPANRTERSGWWEGWDGPAQSIVRETLVRAIRISLGLGRNDAIPSANSITNPLMIELIWACGGEGHPLQGYITWRRSEPGQTGLAGALQVVMTETDEILRDVLDRVRDFIRDVPILKTIIDTSAEIASLSAPLTRIGVSQGRVTTIIFTPAFDGSENTNIQPMLAGVLDPQNAATAEYAESPDTLADALAAQGMIVVGQPSTILLCLGTETESPIGHYVAGVNLCASADPSDPVRAVRPAVNAEGLPSTMISYSPLVDLIGV
jgi:hypothetical protein